MVASIFIKFLTSGILEKLIGVYEKKQGLEAEQAKENLKAEIENRKVQKEVILNEHGWWVTRWCRPFLFYPLALHIVAISLDTIFKFGWGIPSLPSPYNELQFAIILSYFLTRPVEKSVRFFRK